MSSYSIRSRLGRKLDRVAAHEIPDTIDLWPGIAERQARSRPGADPRAWTEPALDTRRRPSSTPTPIEETDETMSTPTFPNTGNDAEPISLDRRNWRREALKFVAAAIVFTIVGAILALALQDDDQTPAVGPSGPTPTATVEATATTAVVPTPTEPAATQTSEPSPTPTLTPFGTVSATIPVGADPRNMAVGEGALWVTNASDGTVSRIDLATNEVTTIEVVPPGTQVVDAIAVGGGAVWVTNQGSIQLARIDPAINQVVANVSLNTAVHELVFGGDALWGRGSFANRIVRVDPATNEVVASITVPAPSSIIYAYDALWSVGVSDVSKIDPATNTVVATVSYTDTPTGPAGIGIVASGDSLWLMSEQLGTELIQIDPATATIVNRIDYPDDVERPFHAGSQDAVYICSCTGQPANPILKLDVATGQITGSLNVPDIEFMIYGDDALWGYSRATREVTRIDLNP